ncbi:hypothetical protein MBH78_06210 [Oceanimonas sp. NS1]|nr:hypothetical protein [Oceanimonas sp. NS1]MCT7654499.1 hypothetical protein [Oceanimonas sp. NS1]
MLKLRFNDFLVKASGELCEPERQEKILTWTGLLQLGVWLAIGKPDHHAFIKDALHIKQTV